ncbi:MULTISPECIES: alkyl sulfatase dimerization domain-containing protein [unclassified Pseudomonas]|uniref:alkyl/aryl-sulfatase n=1 Tax=unclassified Pseudomonas TaxID=196821 RepID=UPI00244CD45A|nr:MULTISPECIES: alkyl sulfatase dimerization domain-containing protein [unclassified Pseudomonas]MDG9929732.1 MBL fold metallo-hydrolase [Pseudomonas sp. GD04042]MDH0484217.1 MBL fold metallo-hydrolase [Pseudomonas sp. GD04015]MDH0605940.1 MBL fold metallo-hydrolase [Pseudomonas sp. GD03869]
MSFSRFSGLLLAATLPFTASAELPTEHIEPSINAELAEHTRHFSEKVYPIADNVWSAVGWNLANSVMIEAPEGLIIVDTGESAEQSRKVLAEFRKISDKPIKAIVYTHFHPDHINGVKGFVSEEQVKSGEVQIYAQESLLDNVVAQGALVGPILSMRSGYSFGAALPDSDKQQMNAGLGPLAHEGASTFIAPTITFKDKLDTTIAGLPVQFLHVPSEAPDEIVLYLPDNRVLISAEVTQGPTLPNIHTLRGTKFRDPVVWVDSLDKLRAFQADYMVPLHGQPVSGKDKVEEVLRMTRDAIAYIHDQTVRWMNKGLTPDELVEKVQLPPHLAGYTPYLREYYGTVKHSVRQIYQGYLGWFQGDPVDLDPIPPKDKAERLIALMGGREKVLLAAGEAYLKGDYQWAAELSGYAIRVDHGDKLARDIKARSFRKLGYASMNINWRNWYLMSAMELEGKLDDGGAEELGRRVRSAFLSSDMLKNLPARIFLQNWVTRIDPEKSADVELTLGFAFPDIGEEWSLDVRRGVAQLRRGIDADTALRLTLDKTYLDTVISGENGLLKGALLGDVKVDGNLLDIKTFLGCFDFAEAPIALTVR